LDLAVSTLDLVESFKLVFSFAVQGIVTTLLSTVTSCFMRFTLSSDTLLNSSKSWLNLVPKSLQSDTGPTVVVEDCRFVLEPEPKEDWISSTALLASLAVLEFSVALAWSALA